MLLALRLVTVTLFPLIVPPYILSALMVPVVMFDALILPMVRVPLVRSSTQVLFRPPLIVPVSLPTPMLFASMTFVLSLPAVMKSATIAPSCVMARL